MKIGSIAEDIRNGNKGEVVSVTRYHVIIRFNGARRFIPKESARRPASFRRKL